jgi:hypothetical protein
MDNEMMRENPSPFRPTGVGLHVEFSVTQTFHEIVVRKKIQKKVGVAVTFCFVVNFILTDCVAYERAVNEQPFFRQGIVCKTVAYHVKIWWQSFQKTHPGTSVQLN